MYYTHSLKLKTLILATALLVFSLVMLSNAPKVSAAYDGSRLIDNSKFLDAGSMNAAQVQSFLTSKGGALASRNFVMNCDAAGTQAKQLYVSIGAPCNQSTSAANIIYYAAQIYGISPRVIMTTMQKEQSLITATNPTGRQYAQAMGYGCPTSGSCDDSSNFFWQVDNGTWVLRFHYERAKGNMSWWYESTSWTCGNRSSDNSYTNSYYKPGLNPGQSVTFYDGLGYRTTGTYTYDDEGVTRTGGVAYRTYTIANAATSAFYCYTPHAYNNPQGLYGRPPFGTVGQYYSGSYNFVYWYEIWFGNPQIDPNKDTTLVGDWDGDGVDSVGIRRGNTYFLDNDNDGDVDWEYGFGLESDTHLIGDWDGDGSDEIALKRGERYYFSYDFNGTSEMYQGFGDPTDKTIVGDWDGDGSDEIGLKRGERYFLNFDYDGKAELYVGFGNATDGVIVGDWDGDGTDELGLRRGDWYYFDYDFDGQSEKIFGYGSSAHSVIIGDWDNDGKDEIGLKRGEFYYLDNNLDGKTEIYTGIGISSDRGMIGDWDGDGKDSIGIKRSYYIFLDDDYDGNAEANYLYSF